MPGMYGADVAQLRGAAEQFDRMADQLNAGRMSVGNAIQISAWVGPFASSFRFQWESEHSLRIANASALLRSGAQRLRANADAQERVSAVDGGSAVFPRIAVGGAVGGGTSTDAQDLLALWMESLGNLTQTGDFAALIGEFKEISKLAAIGKITGPLGVALGTAQLVDDVNSGDYLGAVIHGVSTGLGAVGVVVSKLNPLALGVSALATFIDWTIPYSSEKQDLTLDKGAEILFGDGVDRSQLTPDQSSKLSGRYEGVWGAMNMISDTMDATADRIFPWNWGK
jgi:hypothetical protein